MNVVRWNRVALFYGIAFGIACAATGALVLLGMNLGSKAQLIAQLTVAFVYMPAPLVATLVCERLDGRGYALRRTFEHFGGKILRLLAVCVAAGLGMYVLALAVEFLFGNVARMPGAGHLVTTEAQLLTSIKALFVGGLPPNAASTIPPLWLMYAYGAIGAVLAGFSVNALFAFGEEYGWRGWLQDELRPLGPVRANLLTGVMWGFWHGPMILTGYNYGKHIYLGWLFMAILCVPFSFLLWRARDLTGTVLSAAVLHGMFNGMAGVLLILTPGASPLVRPPAGVLMALAVGITAAVLWWAAARIGDWRAPSAEPPVPEPDLPEAA